MNRLQFDYIISLYKSNFIHIHDNSFQITQGNDNDCALLEIQLWD